MIEILRRFREAGRSSSRVALLIAGTALLSGFLLEARADIYFEDLEARGEDELEAGGEADSPDPSAQRLQDRVPDSLYVPPGTAEQMYRGLSDALATSYAKSEVPVAVVYQQWKRANAAPYHSYSHGRRLLNNYVNEAAEGYFRFEQAGDLPVGAIIAQDSFAVDADGNLLPGPLFVMEKMPAGFNYVSGDWRFTQIEADGRLGGQTKGTNAESVERCIRCHLAAEKTDYLFFVPGPHRPR